MDFHPEEKRDSHVICCSNLPLEFFADRNIAKKYFRRFGKIKVILFKQKIRTCMVEYYSERSVTEAMQAAGEYNGNIFEVLKSSFPLVGKKKIEKSPDPDWASDPEVKAELEAMSGFEPLKSYNLRSSISHMDTSESPKPKRATPKKTYRDSPKSKKKPSPAAAAPSIARNEENELERILRQQALSAEDKYRILEARDKILRLHLRKSEPSQKGGTIGTCPDMCPEKERLMREVQHQVSLFEQGENGRALDPRLAVKQYSRSSADQESPLPHDLRPVGVLQMTMGYLLHKIIDLCNEPDVNIAEWYHFLWDRTRGIRKDITQQELCCQTSVELMEQCARFHIFCSSRLITEDPAVFDQKINTENLTKCLQTLKYMYHDLQLKGQACQNEPEFRAYIILLNLNDGNFMWEVQQLKKEIQESNEVRFALDVYSALDKNNYVRFFKLVQSTTYLNACILLRYFIQVRVKALSILLKCYSPRTSRATLPLFYLTTILGFEDIASTTEFLECYGMHTNSEKKYLILDSKSFSLPEYPHIPYRALEFIESKRQGCIGKVICGKDFPPETYKYHCPQESFDENGFLKLPSFSEDLQGSRENTTVELINDNMDVEENLTDYEHIDVQKLPEATSDQPLMNITTLSFSKPDIAIVEHNIEEADIEKDIEMNNTCEAYDIPTTQMHFSQLPEDVFVSQFTTFSDQEPSGDLAIVEDNLTNATIIEMQWRSPKTCFEDLGQMSNKIHEESILQSNRYEKGLSLSPEPFVESFDLHEVNKDLHYQALEVEESVSAVMTHLLEEVEQQNIEEKINTIYNRISKRKLKIILSHWREVCCKQRKRKIMDDSPAWFSSRTVQEEATELGTSGQLTTLMDMKRYKRGEPSEIYIDDTIKLNQIDFEKLTDQKLFQRYLALNKKLPREIFFKVTLSIPNKNELGKGFHYFERILNEYFKWNVKGSSLFLLQQSKPTQDLTITHCIEKQIGSNSIHTCDSNGIIFIADDLNDALCKRIVNNFTNIGILVKIPMVLILQNHITSNAKLNELIQEGIVSKYLILTEKFTPENLINMIDKAFEFLANNIAKSPPLEMDMLDSFFSKYLCFEIWEKANSFSKWNYEYKHCLWDPSTVIYLYNEAVDRLKKILLNKECYEYLPFPEVLNDFLVNKVPLYFPCDYRYFPKYLNNHVYLKNLREIINSFHIPNWLEHWPPKTYEEMYNGISTYCSRIFVHPEKCISAILDIFSKFIESNGTFECIRQVSWTNVIQLIALEKVNQTDFFLHGTGFVHKSNYNQYVVVYYIDSLAEYTSDWFYVRNPVIRLKVENMFKKKSGKLSHSISTSELKVDIDNIIESLNKSMYSDNSKQQSELELCNKMFNELNDTMAVHKKIQQTSRALLQYMLDEK